MTDRPLTGIRVIELAGLAPVPFAGHLLANYGATVLRIDPTSPDAQPPAKDLLGAHKGSLPLNLKHPSSHALLLSLLPHADILLSPYRPGVLSRLGLDPITVLLKHNPRLIVAQLFGFRPEGKYGKRAGHDINYLAVSGVLAQLGRAGKGETPYAPANMLADFGGGGLVMFAGVLMALLRREREGKGGVVDANMEDGVGGLGTWMRYLIMADKEGSGTGRGIWDRPRGENMLDGGVPWYDTYETADGGFMAVGALEERFWRILLQGLGIEEEKVRGWREKREMWPKLKDLLKKKFMEKTRKEWEEVFDGKDACCTPVLNYDEMKQNGYEQKPMVRLRSALRDKVSDGGAREDECTASNSAGDGWTGKVLQPGEGGEQILSDWMKWKRGIDYDVVNGNWIKLGNVSKL